MQAVCMVSPHHMPCFYHPDLAVPIYRIDKKAIARYVSCSMLVSLDSVQVR